jgi:hypothetical protein
MKMQLSMYLWPSASCHRKHHRVMKERAASNKAAASHHQRLAALNIIWQKQRGEKRNAGVQPAASWRRLAQSEMACIENSGARSGIGVAKAYAISHAAYVIAQSVASSAIAQRSGMAYIIENNHLKASYVAAASLMQWHRCNGVNLESVKTIESYQRRKKRRACNI